MKYCPECGKEIGIENPKFCPHCGLGLMASVNSEPTVDFGSTEITSNEPSTAISDTKLANPSIHDLGTKLEETVKNILRNNGYITERRVRIPDRTGARHEIDILAKKGNHVLFVECKNYALDRPVGMDKMREFHARINTCKDVGYRGGGLFVTYSYFSSDARKFGEGNGIELWDGERLKTERFAIEVGRATTRERPITVELALPVETEYSEATRVDIVNPELVEKAEVKLLLYPYYRIDYRFDVTRKLPNRDKYPYKSKWYCIVDAITQEPIYKKKFNPSEMFFDLTDKVPISDYTVKNEDNFKVEYLRPGINHDTAKRLAKKRIIEETKHNVGYQASNDTFDRRRYTIVLNPEEISITENVLVYVPKWVVTFNSGSVEYKREVWATASREVIYDPISECAIKHSLVDKLKMTDSHAHAICNVCHQPFCEKHVMKSNDDYYCQEHDPNPEAHKKSRFSLFGKKS